MIFYLYNKLLFILKSSHIRALYAYVYSIYNLNNYEIEIQLIKSNNL